MFALSVNLNSLIPVLNCNVELFGIMIEPVKFPFTSDVKVPLLESGWDVAPVCSITEPLDENSTNDFCLENAVISVPSK